MLDRRSFSSSLNETQEDSGSSEIEHTPASLSRTFRYKMLHAKCKFLTTYWPSKLIDLPSRLNNILSHWPCTQSLGGGVSTAVFPPWHLSDIKLAFVSSSQRLYREKSLSIADR
jgi:hypothetical protein